MKDVVSLLILSGIILLFLFVKRTVKEGFAPAEYLIADASRKALPPNHQNYVDTSIRKYNPITNLMNPRNNVLLPPDFKAKDVEFTQNKLKDAVASILAVPNNPSFKLKRGSTADIALNYASIGTGDLINKCEAIKTIQCSAFDNPEFAANCGMCHENGKNSSGSNITGGLFVDDDTKWAIKATAKQQKINSVKYNPTVGTCANGRFTITKQQCEEMKLRMDCERTQSFAIPGCSMDYTSEKFFYLKPETINNSLSAGLVLVGSGTFKISITNKTVREIQLSSEPQAIILTDLKEETIVNIQSFGQGILLAGYLEGITVDGSFIIDIARLATKKYNTANTSRIIGSMNINNDTYAKFSTSAASPLIFSLNVINPFTFIDLLSSDAVDYGAGPYITKEASAKLLNSGVCYKKNADGSVQGPGKYSLECLQDAFITAGCTTQGEAFPTTDEEKGILMSIASVIYDISDEVYKRSLTSYSGVGSDGKELSIEEWDKISRWCTGIRITSPCSIEQAGKYSEKCLKYLWLNLGAKDTSPGGEGPTYSSSNIKASLYNNLDNFCTLNGTGSPTKNGVANAEMINEWNKIGDKDSIKRVMDYIHKMANDNTATDQARSAYTLSCYGIALSTGLGKANTDTEDQSGSYMGSLVDVPIILPYDPNLVGMVPDPYTKILSAGMDSVNKEIAYVYRYTSPASMDVTLYIIAAYYGILFVNGKQLTSKFTLVPNLQLQGQRVKFVKGVNTIKVNVINPFAPANLALIARAGNSNPIGDSLFSTGSPGWKMQGDYLSVLDNKPGRTKTPFVGKPNYTWDPDYTKETAFVLGPYDMKPWFGNGYWSAAYASIPSGMANKAHMSWLWYTAGADVNAPRTTRGMYKLFTNPRNTILNAVLYFICDDFVDYIGLNNKTISNSVIQNFGNVSLTFLPGENCLQVNCKNNGGPGGFVAICYDTAGNVLFGTNPSGAGTLFGPSSPWGWMNNKNGPMP